MNGPARTKWPGSYGSGIGLACAPWTATESSIASCSKADANCVSSKGVVEGGLRAGVGCGTGQSRTIRVPNFFVMSMLHGIDPTKTSVWTTSRTFLIEPLSRISLNEEQGIIHAGTEQAEP
jgi:hypothetical protein